MSIGEGGWVDWIDEKEAVGMSYCGWVGGMDRGEGGGWNELLWAWNGWVGGWEEKRDVPMVWMDCSVSVQAGRPLD